MVGVNWRDDLRKQGYAFFHNLIPKPLVIDACEAIKCDLADNYNPRRKMEYDNQSYCPTLRGTPVITALLRESPISGVLDDLLGWDNIRHDGGQIAIRKAHNHAQAIAPVPHIDGVPTGLNGLCGDEIRNFTALVGIFLTKTPRTFAGNFTVWPGSHHVYERYFRERGRQCMRELPPNLDLGQPVQLMADMGDVVLCHYQLGHSAAVNTSNVDRWAVYFRIAFHDIRDRRWQLLTNIWEGWRLDQSQSVASDVSCPAKPWNRIFARLAVGVTSIRRKLNRADRMDD